MLDIQFLRDFGDMVKADLGRRQDNEKKVWVDEILSDDARWRKLKSEADTLRSERNDLTRKIQTVKSEGKDIVEIVADAKLIPQKIREREDEMEQLKNSINYRLMRLPNVLHESVPIGESDEENVAIKFWGDIVEPNFELVHHGQLAQNLGIADFDRAVKISGAGFYFLKGDLAIMDFALQQLAIQLLTERGYTLVTPPFMMRKKPYEGVTDLADFENVMYKIGGEDQYLIATSEHPMAAMYQDELLDSTELPIKYAGVSACFRREIGKHGLDERGLFRVHQFNKIEQFIFCEPKDSWIFHEELIRNAMDFMEKIEIPYRVVNVCTGDMGTVAAKKYDLEGYSLREKKYIELMSCSNCTSYQSVRLNIRHRTKEGNKHLHTLNSTMVATSRALRLILEHYQQEDGSVVIPKALRPFMMGKEKISPK